MKHTFKRFLTITVIAAAAIFTLTACGNTGLGSKSDGDAKVTKKAPKGSESRRVAVHIVESILCFRA